MAFFDQKSWVKGRENVASLVAAAWTIIALAITIILMNLNLSLLPMARDATAFRLRETTTWPALAFMCAVTFGVIMGLSRYKATPYFVAFLLSVIALVFCCLAIMRSGYVIADQRAVFRRGEPWKPDQIAEANRVVGLLRGCSTSHGKVTSYEPIYKLVVPVKGAYKTFDIGRDVSAKSAAAWTGKVSGLRLPAVQFIRNIGSNRWSYNPRNEPDQDLRQDQDFTECLGAYRKALDTGSFSKFSRLVGSPT